MGRTGAGLEGAPASGKPVHCGPIRREGESNRGAWLLCRAGKVGFVWAGWAPTLSAIFGPLAIQVPAARKARRSLFRSFRRALRAFQRSDRQAKITYSAGV